MRRLYRTKLPRGQPHFHRFSPTSQAGFTLLELAIVLAIMGTVAGAALTLGSAKHEASKYDITVERLDAIEHALRLYAYSAGHLPCPAVPTALPTSAAYGASSSCSGAAPAGITSIGGGSSEIWIGSIPTRTLNLPDSYMYDGWLGRFSYAAIAQLASTPSSFTTYAGGTTTGIIRILDYNGNQVPDAQADTVIAYALISHGKDTKGALNRAGIMPATCGANVTIDDENCDLDETFVDSRIVDSETPAKYYDDLVRWKSKNFMEPLKGEALTTAQPIYLYIPDTANHRVQKFDSEGNFILEFGTYGTALGELAYPKYAAADSRGDVYVTEDGNTRVQKFDSTGNPLMIIGGPGTADGEFDQVLGVAVDNNDNLYVTDVGRNEVNKFDSNGNFILKFGGSGSGPGQFNGCETIAVDSSNNVLIQDQWNNRVQKFDGAGNYISEFGSYGSGPGQFDQSEGISLDKSDNIYITDDGNHRIQKFSPSGVYISEFDATANTNWLEGLTVDENGYIYVVSEDLNHVLKFDSNGNLIKMFGSSGSGPGQFNVLFGIATGSK